MKHTSGSPTAWKARREAYKKSSSRVSNPGQPSSVNRKARRDKALAQRVATKLRSISDES